MFFPGASPMETLQTFELYKVQGLIASPGGLSGFLRFYEDNADFRSGFQVIISAGRPLPKSLSERVRARLALTGVAGGRGIYRARCIGAGRR
jgi:hypothetical protein